MSDDGMSCILAVLERLEQGQGRLEDEVTRLRTNLMARKDGAGDDGGAGHADEALRQVRSVSESHSTP